MGISVIIDFDGTISLRDISELILIHFAKGDWQKFEDQANRGEITIDECIISQYAMISGEFEDIMKMVNQEKIRQGFETFIEFCKEQGFQVTCVSAGLSFVIEHIFEKLGIQIPVIAPVSEFSNGRVTTTVIPTVPDYIGFKHQAVKQEQDKGQYVIYLGDGSSDRVGIQHADYRFVVRDKSLHQLCHDENIAHSSFDTFDQVRDEIQQLII